MSRRNARLEKLFIARYGCQPCCLKCGEVTYELDMHHLDSRSKCFNPSCATSFVAYWNETEKCVPLCKDCHKEVHKIYGRSVKLKQTREWLDL